MSEPDLESRVREHRAALDLSQTQLGELVGVSRQAISAIEAGRQVPSTTLALELSRHLGCRVEDLFALPAASSVSAKLIGDAGQASSRCLLGNVDGSWVAHAPLGLGAASDGIVVGGARKAAGRAVVRTLVPPSELESKVLVAGCAPLLGVLGDLWMAAGARAHTEWLATSSMRSLELLQSGAVHVAGVHLVESDRTGGHSGIVREQLPGKEHTIVHLAKWRQGLAVLPHNPKGIHEVADTLRSDVTFVRRDPGAGAARLHERLLSEARLCADPKGPLASGHGEAARLVQLELADAAIVIEPVALAAGLDFLPLVEERFDLVVPSHRLTSSPVERLLSSLEERSFRLQVEHMVGYDISGAGHATTVSA